MRQKAKFNLDFGRNLKFQRNLTRYSGCVTVSGTPFFADILSQCQTNDTLYGVQPDYKLEYLKCRVLYKIRDCRNTVNNRGSTTALVFRSI